MRNVLWILAIVIAVVVFAVRKVSGRGTVVVVGPSDRAITVSIDGNNRHVGGDQVEKLAVKKGFHQVTIKDGTDFRTRDIEINSADDTLFVPATDGACYVLLDMSGAYVDKKSATPNQQLRMPTVVARWSNATSYVVPELDDTYFMRIPKETYSDHVFYVRAVNCSSLSHDDERLVAEAVATMKVGR